MNSENKKETYLEAYFDSSKEISALIGKEGEVLLYNNTAGEFVKTYFNKDIREGELFIDYCSPDLRDFYSDSITQALEGREVLDGEIEQKYGSGRIVWKISFIPVRDGNKAVYAVAFSGENITEYKIQQEKNMEQYNSLKKISFRTSHIIRAPLANILGLINIIRLNGYADPGNEKLFELIAVSAEQLDKILRDIAAEASSPGTPGDKPFF